MTSARNIRYLIICIILSMLFFVFLYFNNNKYTCGGTQAKNGVLDLTGTELPDTPMRFLTDGWAFYPDKLLTGSELQQNPSLYVNYITIGDSVHFNLSGRRANPHGCGTYVLTLSLPDSPSSYSLLLPEIYSAYRLYADDQLLFQSGCPDKDTYSDRTEEQLITFEASGRVTLLLAVSDYSHFYSGLVYPPAFGTTSSVNDYHNMRLILCVVIVSLGLIAAILSAYLGLRLKHPDALLFTLLCISVTACNAYPLVHTLFSLSIRPYYAFELSYYYLVTLFIIILVNRICHVRYPLGMITGCAAASFVCISFVYGITSARHDTATMNLFSDCVFVYKIITACYLLFCVLHYMKQNQLKTRPLYTASLFYTTALLSDRIFSGYEPVYFGWFAEYAFTFFAVTIGYVLLRNMMDTYTQNLVFAEEHRQMHRILDMQTEYARQIEEKNRENHRLSHDLRHHIRILNTLTEKKDWTELSDYLQSITCTIPVTDTVPFCSNLSLDAIFQYYNECCRQHNIDIRITFDPPGSPAMSTVELCTVFSNLLENAYEACNRQTSGTRQILLTARTEGKMWIVAVENTYDGIYSREGAAFLSRKRNQRSIGIGLESVRRILQLYDCTLDIFPDEHIFRIGFMMPEDSVSQETKLSE